MLSSRSHSISKHVLIVSMTRFRNRVRSAVVVVVSALLMVVAANDPDDRRLSLDLPTIIRDLDTIRGAVGSYDGRLAVSSFAWCVRDGLLDPVRGAGVYDYLNDMFWPFSYAYLRRMADFQNRTLEVYARSRGAEGVHMTAPDTKLMAWITFAALGVDARPTHERRDVSAALDANGSLASGVCRPDAAAHVGRGDSRPLRFVTWLPGSALAAKQALPGVLGFCLSAGGTDAARAVHGSLVHPAKHDSNVRPDSDDVKLANST